MTTSLFGKAHVNRYVETGGEVGQDRRNGAPVLILTTTGRRSGQPRSTPLIYGRDGNNYLLVASRGGADKSPAWYLNLAGEPGAAGAGQGGSLHGAGPDCHPRGDAGTVEDDDAVWPDHDAYQLRTRRDIPVVILERV